MSITSGNARQFLTQVNDEIHQPEEIKYRRLIARAPVTLMSGGGGQLWRVALYLGKLIRGPAAKDSVLWMSTGMIT
jgi:hypothetical protein